MGTTTTSTAHPDHPLCVLPSCGNHVERWGQPCQDCGTAFGPRLRPTCAPAMTREQIAERDRDVERVLALRHQVRADHPATDDPPRPRRRSA